MLNGVVSWIDSGGLVSRLSLGLGWMVSKGISSHRLRGAPFGWAAIGWEDSRGDMFPRPCIAQLCRNETEGEWTRNIIGVSGTRPLDGGWVVGVDG
jgi:hypothetical protein